MNRSVFQKMLAILLAVLLAAGVMPVSLAAPAEKAPAGDFSVATLSDIRYFPDSLAGDKGEAYYAYTQAAGVNGRDQDALLDAAFASLRYRAERDGLDCVVICGDLTAGGEYEGAAALADKLRRFAFASGLRVYVLNGDRDINNPDAADFTTNRKTSARGVTQAEFLDLFRSFGYQDAYHVYQPLGSGVYGALSYSLQTEEGYRLIMADGSRYTADATEDRTDTAMPGGVIAEPLLQWVIDEAADAAENGEIPLLFTHTGLVPMNDFAEYVLGAVMDGADTVRDALAEAGILCAFSGGVNAADTNVYDSDCGRPLYAVSAPSVTQFPFAYRVTRFDSGVDGSVDLRFEQYDCDETGPVKAAGGDYPTPYRSIGFARQFGGDAAVWGSRVAKEKLGEICEDIIRTGGVVAYIEKLFDVDVRSAVVSAVGDGIRLGPVPLVTSANVLSFIEDLDAGLMDRYVRRPSNLYAAVERAVKAFTDLPVSKLPCSRYLDTYGFGSMQQGGTLGEMILDLLATVKPGDESIALDAFLRDAIRNCATPEFAGTLARTLRTAVVDGILVDEILANTSFRFGSLFSDGVLSEAVYVQMFFSVILAVAASRLLEAKSGGDAWAALSKLLTGGETVSVGSALDLLLNNGQNASGTTVDEFLDTVFGLLFGEEQLTAIGDQLGKYLNDLCYDNTADTGRRYEYRGAGEPVVNEQNMRAPSMVQIAVNGNTSFTVTWFTKATVTGTDIELIRDGGTFTGTPTVSDLIASETTKSTFEGFGFDCGNYGFLPYSREAVRHVITVRGLVAGTKLRFRIGDAQKGFWKECTFDTGLPDKAFTFLTLCDSDGVTDDSFEAFANALRLGEKAWDPAFIVHAGNLVRNPASDAQWSRALDGAADVLARVPLLYASGSNDANGGYSVRKHLTCSRTPMQFEEDGVYYSFDYGNAHFAVVNTNSLQADGGLTDRQLTWLKNDLSGSRADWKILVCYAPVFGVENQAPRLDAQLSSVVGACGVDLVLEGGVGGYLRTRPLRGGSPADVLTETVQVNGRYYPVYIENGCFLAVSSGLCGGGAKQMEIRSPLVAVSDRLETPVYSAVTVTDDTLCVAAYTVVDGVAQQIDSYGLRKDSVVYLPGDADMDGEVTPADARLTLRIAVGLDRVTPITKAAADVDGDVYVSPADARLVLRMAVALEPLREETRIFLTELAKYKNA